MRQLLGDYPLLHKTAGIKVSRATWARVDFVERFEERRTDLMTQPIRLVCILSSKEDSIVSTMFPTHRMYI